MAIIENETAPEQWSGVGPLWPCDTEKVFDELDAAAKMIAPYDYPTSDG